MVEQLLLEQVALFCPLPHLIGVRAIAVDNIDQLTNLMLVLLLVLVQGILHFLHSHLIGPQRLLNLLPPKLLALRHH